MPKSTDLIYFTYKGIKQEMREKGTFVQENWLNDFENFKKWMLDSGYEYNNPDYQFYLQRKNKELGFTEDNCFLRVRGRKIDSDKLKKNNKKV